MLFIEMEMLILGDFLCPMSYGIVTHFASNKMFCNYEEYGVLISICKWVVRSFLKTIIFCIQQMFHCSPVSVILLIHTSWNDGGASRINSFRIVLSGPFNFIPQVLNVTREQADVKKAAEVD